MIGIDGGSGVDRLQIKGIGRQLALLKAGKA
jgi:hypothetical protein